MNIIDGNILEGASDIILHQVNCKGVMGSGIARQIRDRYPIVYDEYKKVCDMYRPDTSKLLGSIQSCRIGSGKYIVNLFAQDRYGRDWERYTDYEALESCLKRVNKMYTGKTVGIPYMMSCGRGGGDWGIVSKMIENCLKNCYVTIYKYNA